MATFAIAPQSPTRSGSPSPPDRRSKEIPPPLSLTVDAPAPSSPFPSPSSSFVPPPVPGAHEFANKPPTGRFVRRKKSSSASNAIEEPGSPAASKTADVQNTQSMEGLREPNGAPTLDTEMRSSRPNSGTAAAVTPNTPTPASMNMTPTSTSPPDADAPHFSNLLAPQPTAPDDAGSANVIDAPPSGRNTPTQMHITLPPPPASPSQIFSNLAGRTPSGSGTASKHTSLSSSRPAPASPSPAPSRRQSGVPSLRSRHRSGLSTASTSSASKFGTFKPTSKRRGEIKIRDFAFAGTDPRHKGHGPDAPKVIRKLLKQHGPVAERRESGMSESSVDSEEGSSRRSSGFGGWGAFRWASKLGGPFGFGSGSAGGSRTSGSASGYTPSQQDFERNFDDAAAVDLDVASPADDDADADYSSDYDDGDADGDGDGESEELLPGLYRALYDFDPEGTAEMGLKEGQVVKVVGRGGGVGWAIAIRPEGAQQPAEGESNWALVPESYLRVVKLDEDAEQDEPEPEDAGGGEGHV